MQDSPQGPGAIAKVDTLRPAIDPGRIQRFGRLTRRGAILRYNLKNMAPSARCEMLVDFEAAYAWVKTLNEERTRARRITLHHVALMGMAKALRNHIFLNYAYDGGYRLHPVDRIDIRTPVDLGDFPQFIVIPETDTLSIQELANAFYRARDMLTSEALTPIEQRIQFFALPWAITRPIFAISKILGAFRRLFPGWHAAALEANRTWMGSFAVSNVGTLGAEGGAGILVRPSIAIAGVFRVHRQAMVIDKTKIEIRRAGKVSVGFDHRFVDGAQATRFLLEVKRNIESPEEYLTKDPAAPMFPDTFGGILP